MSPIVHFATRLRVGLLLMLITASCVAAPVTVPSAAPEVTEKAVYQDIPPGFDFPADEETLLRFRDTQNVAEQRRHAWYVWAGMTQPAPGGEAVWETWYSFDETFNPAPQPGDPSAPEEPVARETQRDFAVPQQFIQTDGADPQAIGESLMSFVLFNAPARRHIRDNNFHLHDHLTELNEQLTEAGTPAAERDITPFPPDAVALKTVWWIVAHDQLTPMPIWDFAPVRLDAQGNPFPFWARFIAVDAARSEVPANEVIDIPFSGVLRANSHVVSVNDFYNFRFETQAQVDAANSSFLGSVFPFIMGRPIEIGDYAVLVALHYTTKEIPDWVWGTFWWHDRPDEGPFALDRPAAVQGVWRNYLMDTAYSMVTPREFDGTPNSVYNPWLEARFDADVAGGPGGLSTNCMTCHQQSVWIGEPIGFSVTTGGMAPDDPYFDNALQLDFLWSLGRDLGSE